VLVARTVRWTKNGSCSCDKLRAGTGGSIAVSETQVARNLHGFILNQTEDCCISQFSSVCHQTPPIPSNAGYQVNIETPLQYGKIPLQKARPSAGKRGSSVFPGKEDNDVKCSLSHIPISVAAEPFGCVSYCWSKSMANPPEIDFDHEAFAVICLNVRLWPTSSL
jgi:hypothetical protein